MYLKWNFLIEFRWDNLISSSKYLMSKFQIVLEDDYDYYEDAMELKRNHQKIIIKNLCADSLDVLCLYNLSVLNVCHSEHLKLSDLCEAIRSVPMLKVFSAWEVKFEDDIPDIENFNRISVKIETIRCVAEVLLIFKCSTFKTVRLLWNHEMSLERKMLTYELLGQQKNLKNLILAEYRADNFFHSPEIFLKFQFSLKSFKYFNPSPLNNYKNFIRFLESQNKSLSTLEIDVQPRDMFIIEEIQKYVLENMSNVKDLVLHLSIRDDTEEATEWLSEMDEKPQPTHVTKNIERLSYKGPHRTSAESKLILDLFPNIKHLNFESDYVEEFRLLKYVSKANVKLESLAFLDFHGVDLKKSYSVYFPNLKNLSTFGIYNEKVFSSFILRHSDTLQSITVEDTDDMTERTANAIMKCENLKFLSLEACKCNLLSTMRLFHEISSRGIDKPLTFIFKHYSSSETFKFPEDKIFWDEMLGIEPEIVEEAVLEDEPVLKDEPALKHNSVKGFWKTIWHGLNNIFC